MAESRSVVKLFGVSALALVAMTGVALADGYAGSIKDAPAKPEREFTYSFTLTGTSDYVFRGVSQSDNDPAIQGSANVGYGIFYAGIWMSSIDFKDDAQIEADYYAGIKPTWGPATFDFGVLYYDYPGYNAVNNEYLELKASVSGEIWKSLSATATLYYHPDYNGREYFVYEGGLAYTLPTFHIFTPTLSGQVGHYDWDVGGTDYTYWNAGLALAVDKLTFDFRYWDTDYASSVCPPMASNQSACGERFVFSVTLALP